VNAALAYTRPGAHINALDAQWIIKKLHEDVVSGVEAAVLVHLTALCHGDGWTRTSIDEIASAIKFEPRTVCTAVNSLHRRELLEVRHNTRRSSDGKTYYLESDYRLPIETLLLQPVSARYGGSPERRRHPHKNKGKNKGKLATAPVSEVSSEVSAATAPSEGPNDPHDPGSPHPDPTSGPHDPTTRPHDPGSSSFKIRKDPTKEKKGEAAPPEEGEVSSPETTFLANWAKAYEAQYGVPPIERDDDRKHAKALLRAARTQAEAYRGRCEARGEASAPLDELVAACADRWLGAYLADKGSVSERSPEGFLVGRRHPLPRLLDDLEKYGTPWAASEKRQAATRAEHERLEREAQARAKQAAHDQAKREATARFYAKHTVVPQAPIPEPVPVPSAAPSDAPGEALEAPADVPEPPVSGCWEVEPEVDVFAVHVPATEAPAPVDQPIATEPMAEPLEAQATADETAPPCTFEDPVCPGMPRPLVFEAPAVNDLDEPGGARTPLPELEAMRRGWLAVQQRQVATMFDDGRYDTPEDIQRTLRESGLLSESPPPALPALRAARRNALEAKRAEQAARALEESRALAVWLSDAEGSELLALLVRPRASLSPKESLRMNRLMAKAWTTREAQEGTGLPRPPPLPLLLVRP
jgi:hypothetical protein